MATTTAKRRMRATLVRFGPELYEELRAEAARTGVSVAEYVREAVVARMAYTAGRRGDASYTDAARQAAGLARAEAARVREEASAVRAENAQARGQARKVMTRAQERTR
jgi:Ribbon-helix-helix domain